VQRRANDVLHHQEQGVAVFADLEILQIYG
jgi:hypothetical protein